MNPVLTHSRGTDFRQELAMAIMRGTSSASDNNNFSILYGFNFFDEAFLSWSSVLVRVAAGKDYRCTFDVPSMKTTAGGETPARKRLCYPMIDLFFSEDRDSRDRRSDFSLKDVGGIELASTFQVDVHPAAHAWRVLLSTREGNEDCCSLCDNNETDNAVIGFVCPTKIQKALDDLANVCEDSNEISAFHRTCKKTRRD